MKYFEFEKNISEKLKNETIGFNADDLLRNLSKRKKKKHLLFWYLPIALVSILSLSAFHLMDRNTSITFPDVSDINVIDENKMQTISNPPDASSKLISTDKFDVKEETKQLVNSKQGLIKKSINKESLIIKSGIESVGSDKIKTYSKSKNDINISDKANLKSNNNDNRNQIRSNELLFKKEKSSNDNMVDFSLRNKVEALSVIGHDNKSNLQSIFKYSRMGAFNNDCPDFSQSDKSAGIEIMAEVGVFKPIKTLENISNETNILTGLRQGNEKPLIGLQAGLYLKYNLSRSPFYIFGGANYSKFTEKMKLDFVTTEIDTTIGVVSITESELGDTITYIYGELYTETTTTGTKTKHYSISTIDIPIHVGYELDLNDFSIGVEGGIAVNVSVVSSGQFLASQSDFKDLKMDSPFKKKVGIRYDGKIFAAYKLDQRQKIYFSAGLNVYPSSFSNKEENTNQTYKQIGLNLGYGFLF